MECGGCVGAANRGKCNAAADPTRDRDARVVAVEEVEGQGGNSIGSFGPKNGPNIGQKTGPR